MNPGPWTEQENDCLLKAIEKHRRIDWIVEDVSQQTGRSQRSIIKRLQKIGYKPECMGKYVPSSNLGI